MAEQSGPTEQQLAQLKEAGCRVHDGHVIRKNPGYITVVPWGQTAMIARLPYTVGDLESATSTMAAAMSVIDKANAETAAREAAQAEAVVAEDAALDDLIAAAKKKPAAPTPATAPAAAAASAATDEKKAV